MMMRLAVHRAPRGGRVTMRGTLTHADGSVTTASTDAVQQALTGRDFFWLNLDDLDDEASELLLHTFGFHPLAVEDAQHFGQRPKVEDYDGFTYFVVHGAEDVSTGGTVEVHLFYTPQRLVTVHRGCAPLFDEVRLRLARHPPAADAPVPGSRPAGSHPPKPRGPGCHDRHGPGPRCTRHPAEALTQL
jgi:Mg2+ and Co2+ transporter CorA